MSNTIKNLIDLFNQKDSYKDYNEFLAKELNLTLVEGCILLGESFYDFLEDMQVHYCNEFNDQYIKLDDTINSIYVKFIKLNNLTVLLDFNNLKKNIVTQQPFLKTV